MASIFALTAPALVAGGYSPIPVGPWGVCDWNPKGKEPARFDVNHDGEPEWYRLKHWQLFCERQAHPKIIAHWSTWPDAGVGLACGFGGVVAVDVDDDDLIAPLLDVLPPVVIGKRGRKGETFFFRSAELLPSKNYRTTDKRGLLDFLSGGKQTVLPGSPHPAGGNYIWTTERTLLDTPLADLPEITGAHVVAMEELLREHGWDDRSKRELAPRATARPVVRAVVTRHDRDLNSTALSNIHAWAPRLRLSKGHWQGGSYRGVAHWRASSGGRGAAQRSANLSIHPDGIVDFGGGENFTPIKLVSYAQDLDHDKAAAWLREQLNLPQTPEPLIRLSNPQIKTDEVPTLDEASAILDRVIRQFFLEVVPKARADRIKYDLAKANWNAGVGKHPLWVLDLVAWLIRCDAGIGKSHTMRRVVAEFLRRHIHPVIAVPDHKLAGEVVTAFAKIGINARVYRGYGQPDPDDSAHEMCRNPVALKAAQDLCVSVQTSVCEQSVGDGIKVRCPLFDACGMQKQRKAEPDLWIVPVALLTQKRPDFIPQPDALVIDENFHKIFAGKARSIAIDKIAALPTTENGCDHKENAELDTARNRLTMSLRANGMGALSRDVLTDNGFDANGAARLAALESALLRVRHLEPGMDAKTMRDQVTSYRAGNAAARTMADLWNAIAEFLIAGHDRSGRITLRKKDGIDVVEVVPVSPVHDTWRAPALLLDATPAGVEIMQTVLDGWTVHKAADVTARWSDHVFVRQIVNARIGRGALGLAEEGRKIGNVGRYNRRHILRYIKQRAASYRPDRVGVITYKQHLAAMADDLPPDMKRMHFGNLAGLDSMKDVDLLIVIGREWPPVAAIERDASIIAGRPVDPIGHFYERDPGFIQLANGGRVETIVERHHDAIAESLRWLATEGGLIQAVCRLRAHRRSEPCQLEIVSDVAVPGVVVHEVVEWANPTAEADMLDEGVVLTNRVDAAQVFGISERAGNEATEGVKLVPKPYREYNIKGFGTSFPARRFTYRRQGARGPASTGVLLIDIRTGGQAALRGWLESNLGPLASLEIEMVRVKDSDRAKAALVKTWQATEDRFKFQNVFAPVLESIEAFFQDLEKQDE